MTMERSVEGAENVSQFGWQPAMNVNYFAVFSYYVVIHEYVKNVICVNSDVAMLKNP